MSTMRNKSFICSVREPKKRKRVSFMAEAVENNPGHSRKVRQTGTWKMTEKLLSSAAIVAAFIRDLPFLLLC